MNRQERSGHELAIRDLGKSFVIDGRVHPVFGRLDLDIERGEFVVIVGESGSGKTTLLRIIAGLEAADCGSVAVNGKVVGGVGSERLMVFQEPRLLPWLTVRKNVSFGLELRARPRQAIDRKVDDALRLVGLEAFASAYPGQLSGGMAQRIGIARALVTESRDPAARRAARRPRRHDQNAHAARAGAALAEQRGNDDHGDPRHRGSRIPCRQDRRHGGWSRGFRRGNCCPAVTATRPQRSRIRRDPQKSAVAI